MGQRLSIVTAEIANPNTIIIRILESFGKTMHKISAFS